MKKLIIFLFLISTLQTFSQIDLNYAGPAKLMVSSYQQQYKVLTESIAKGQYSTAETKVSYLEKLIEKIKAKDPSFSILEMENNVSKMKSKYLKEKKEAEENREKNSKQLFANIETMQKLDLLKSSVLSQENANLLLSLDISTIDMMQYQENLEEFSKNVINENIPTLKSRITNTPIIQETLIWYDKLQDQKRLWATASKMIPGSKVIASTYQKFVALDTELGGIENIKAKAKERYIERLKTMKMPKAATHDAAVEQIFKTAFIDDHKGAKGTKTILKINLTDAGWTTLYNKLTGIVMARKRSAAIAFKENETGECVLYRSFEIIQEYTGSGYGRAKGRSNTAETILCENVK